MSLVHWAIHWSPDGTPPPRQLEAVAPGLGLAYHHLDGRSLSPIRKGNLLFVGMVHLDERAALCARLHLPFETSDEHLVLAAWQAWGSDALRMLTGVWSFALWNETDRHLLLARDPLGIRPLFFAPLPKGGIVAADRIEATLALLSSFPRPNLPLLSHLVAGRFERLQTETAWHGLYRLPGGYVLEARPRARPPRRYYLFGQRAEQPPKRLEEVAEHLRHLFDEAVRVRLDQEHPTTILVSGGLSSALIVGTTHLLQNRGIVGDVRMATLSFSEERATPEHGVIEQMARRYPFPRLEHAGEPLLTWRMSEGDDTGCFYEPYLFLHAEPFMRLFHLIRQAGGYTLLSGGGGHVVMGGMAIHHGRCWRDRPLWQWPHTMLAVRRHYHHSVGQLMKQALTPGWPGRLLGRPGTRLPLLSDAPISWAGREIVRALTSGTALLAIETWHTLAAWNELEIRFPFYDVRLVETMLTLPATWHFREGKERWLMRQAFATRLPHMLRFRPDTGDTLTQVAVQHLNGAGRDQAMALLHVEGMEQVVTPANHEWAESLLTTRQVTPLHYKRLLPLLAVGAWFETYHRLSANPAALRRRLFETKRMKKR